MLHEKHATSPFADCNFEDLTRQLKHMKTALVKDFFGGYSWLGCGMGSYLLPLFYTRVSDQVSNEEGRILIVDPGISRPMFQWQEEGKLRQFKKMK